jgi:predicted transglutaminase-like protease
MLQDNRDKRVELLQKYARKFFPSTRYLDYALTVERYTLTKAANLVLNVDGCIGALFLDLLHSSSMFSPVRHFLAAFCPVKFPCEASLGKPPGTQSLIISGVETMGLMHDLAI